MFGLIGRIVDWIQKTPRSPSADGERGAFLEPDVKQAVQDIRNNGLVAKASPLMAHGVVLQLGAESNQEREATLRLGFRQH